MARRSRRSAEYIITTDVDATGVAAGIAKITAEFGDLNKKGKKAFSGMQDGAGNFLKKLGAGEETVSKFGKIGSSAFGGIDKALGGIPSGLMGMIKGIKGANGGFKVMKGAIASTGIGLLVIALGELVTYLMNSKTFIDLMNKAMDRMKAVMKPLVDTLFMFGNALKALWDGDPDAAWNIAADAVTGFGDRMVDAQKNVTAMHKAQDALNELLKEGELIQAKYNREAFKQEQIARDRNKSDAVRIEALKELKRLQESALQVEIDQANLEVETLERKSKLQKLSIDENARLNELYVEQLKLQTEKDRITIEFEEDMKDIEEDKADRAEDARRDAERDAEDEADRQADILRRQQDLQKELSYLRMTEREQAKQDAKEEFDERMEAAGNNFILRLQAEKQYELDKKAIKDEFDQIEQDAEDQKTRDAARNLAELENALRTQEEKEREAVRLQYEELLKLADEFGKGKEELLEQQRLAYAAIEKKHSNDTIKLEKLTAKKKIEISMAVMTSLIDLARAGESEDEANSRRRFETDKKLGIGMATVNTAIAISDALAKDSVAPFSRYASAVMAGAAGLAQIIAIKNTQFDSPDTTIDTNIGGGAGGQNVINEAPQLDLSFMGEGAGQMGVQAYVVSNQMTSSQQAQQQIQDQASLVA
jgi:hypothetical protein